MFWDLETSQWNITSRQVLASFEKLLYSDHNMHCSTDHEFCFACTCQDLFACLFVVLKYVHLFFWIDTSVHLLVSHSTLGFWVLREWKITSTLSWVREKQNCSSPTIQYILFQFSKLKKAVALRFCHFLFFPCSNIPLNFMGIPIWAKVVNILSQLSASFEIFSRVLRTTLIFKLSYWKSNFLLYFPTYIMITYYNSKQEIQTWHAPFQPHQNLNVNVKTIILKVYK